MKTKINTELHNLDPSTLIELYQIDLKGKGRYYFHAGENGFKKEIVFNSQEYDFIPMRATGFEYKGDGRLPRPSMTISNHMGFMSIKAVYFDDFIGHKVRRIKTFARFIDDVNFPNSVNPFGAPDFDETFAVDEYYVNQKTKEDKNLVEFELVSILELEGANVPARRIMADYCCWTYRGRRGCGYDGEPAADIYNKKIKDGGYDGNLIGADSFLGSDDFIRTGPSIDIVQWSPGEYYDRGQVVELFPFESNPFTKPSSLFICLTDKTRSDPRTDSENWVKDECSKNLQGCRLRYGAGAPEAQERTKGLPFGAFPGVSKYKFE